MSEPIHPALAAGKTAVITGGASGIGLAAAKTFAGLGMKIALIDLGSERVNKAVGAVATIAAGSSQDLLGIETDVSDQTAIERARDPAEVTRRQVEDGNVGVLREQARPFEADHGEACAVGRYR